MGRILALDLGKKRTGLAVTDPLKIIATALDYVATTELMGYLELYCSKEPVEKIVLGYPTDLKSRETDATQFVKDFFENLKTKFPDISIILHDERFTSKMALQSMIDSGHTKKQRREKGNIDKISAVILLNSYLQ